MSVDSLIRWAHHGLALIESFNGRPVRALAHYEDALAGRSTLRDTIEMFVLSAQHDTALKALDRFTRLNHDESAMQFAQSFRGFTWMAAGHCTQALSEIARTLKAKPLLQATSPVGSATSCRRRLSGGSSCELAVDGLVLARAALPRGRRVEGQEDQARKRAGEGPSRSAEPYRKAGSCTPGFEPGHPHLPGARRLRPSS